MSDGLMFALVIGGFVLIVVLRAAFSARAKRRREQNAAAEKERNETLFRSMFPELQPLYHPERLIEFVDARTRGKVNARGKRDWDWNNPPGFPGLRARITATEKGERVDLNDAAGKLVSSFLYEAAPAIGVMRVANGKGKLTVDLSNRPAPRVRYWHPEREFKWSLKGWVFKTAVADEPFTSSSSDSASTSFTSSSSSDSRPAAAAAFAGAGGTFDGGGAAGSWDAAAGNASPADASDGSNDSTTATAY